MTAHHPNQWLRKKLSVAGIQDSQQSFAELAQLVPGSFNSILLNGMTADMLAELVLYFISKGIIATPLASNKALLDLPWGSHVCQFYEGKNDLLEMLVPYFKQGLEKNEACVWLVGDLTVDEARNALLAVVPDLEQYEATGQMQIRHYTEFYTDTDGTVKSADVLTDGFAGMGTSVQEQGFEGLRASGSVSWVKDEEGMTRFMDYETKVNYAIQSSKIMAVCTYPAEAAAFHQCRDLLHNHGKLFVKRGEWVHDKSNDAEIIETIFSSLARI